MNKIFVIFALMILTGCATISSGYIPNKNTNENEIIVLPDKRQNITFSMSFRSEVGESQSTTLQKKMIDTIREKFRKSNLFKKVHYVSFENKSKYHYHFDMKLTGAAENEQIVTGYVSGMTLMLFPMWVNYYADTSMIFYVNGKEVYSVSSPEAIKDVFWLPLIVATPFLNYATVGDYIINKNINYFLDSIIENKLYQI